MVGPAERTRSAAETFWPGAAPSRTSAGGRGGTWRGSRRRRTAQARVAVARRRSAPCIVRDWNLWVRDVASGKEVTTDEGRREGLRLRHRQRRLGEERSANREVVAGLEEGRDVPAGSAQVRGDMYLVSTKAGHPEMQAWKYPLPGDADVTMIHRVIIDTDTGKLVRIRMDPDQHRSTLCDNLACRGGNWDNVQWNPNSNDVAFASSSRDHKAVSLKVAHVMRPNQTHGDGTMSNYMMRRRWDNFVKKLMGAEPPKDTRSARAAAAHRRRLQACPMLLPAREPGSRPAIRSRCRGMDSDREDPCRRSRSRRLVR